MMICHPVVALVLYGIVDPKIEIKLDKIVLQFYWGKRRYL